MQTGIPYELARQFIESENLKLSPNPAFKFKYALGEVIEFSDCFYFNFELLNLDGRPCDQTPIGGAPGFIITKHDQEVRLITFGKLADLKQHAK